MKRPAGVPESATFEPAAGRWVQGSLDPSGQRQGMWSAWRNDGSMYEEAAYENGELNTIRLFHPDGTVAVESTWHDGYAEHIVFHRGPDETDVELPSGWGCSVVRCERWAGEPFTWRTTEFTNDQDLQCAMDGSALPPRPATVHEDAQYLPADTEGTARWVTGLVEQGSGQPVGLRTWQTEGGELLQVSSYDERGRLRFTRPASVDDPTRRLVEDFAQDGSLDWLTLQRYFDDALHEKLAAVRGQVARAHYAGVLRHADRRKGRSFHETFARYDLIAALFDADPPAAFNEEHTRAFLGHAAAAWMAIGRRDRLSQYADALKDSGVLASFRQAHPHLDGWLAGRDHHLQTSDSDEAIALAAGQQLGHVDARVVLRQGGRALLTDALGRSAWFDGSNLVAAPIGVDRFGLTLSRVALSQRCSDEHTLRWSRREGWWRRQRYGEHLLLSGSRFNPSSFDNELVIDLVIHAQDAAWRQRVTDLFDAMAPNDAAVLAPGQPLFRQLRSRIDQPRHGPTVVLGSQGGEVLFGRGAAPDVGVLPSRHTNDERAPLEVVENVDPAFIDDRLDHHETRLLHQGYTLVNMSLSPE